MNHDGLKRLRPDDVIEPLWRDKRTEGTDRDEEAHL